MTLPSRPVASLVCCCGCRNVCDTSPFTRASEPHRFTAIAPGTDCAVPEDAIDSLDPAVRAATDDDAVDVIVAPSLLMLLLVIVDAAPDV